MKLLCIEDNVALVKSLKQFLDSGSQITGATTGKSGLLLAMSNQYDAIVLDLGLPDMPGMEVCLALRGANIDTPIIILSGTKDLNTKVSLIEAGADDYLSKPFSVAELRARLLALLRRNNFSPEPHYFHLLKVGGLTLDPVSRRVERDGQPIELRRKEFDILEYLMRNQDKIMTRATIMDNVWDADSSSWDGTVNVHIKNLRDRIDRPFKHKLIKTAYGLGYTINDRV